MKKHIPSSRAEPTNGNLHCNDLVGSKNITRFYGEGETMHEPQSSLDVKGSENLEVMEDAVNYNAFLLDQINAAMNASQRIVDFGSGTGTFAISMSRTYDLVCIEPESHLRNRLLERDLVAYASLESLDDNSVDGIYTLNVLEHIEDDVSAMALLFSKIAKGGVLYVYVPAFQILYSAMDKRVGHVRRYRLGELTEKIHNAGFEIEKSGYCDSLGFIASLLYKVMQSGDGTINRNSLIFYDRWIFPVSRFFDFFLHRFLGKNTYLIARKI